MSIETLIPGVGSLLVFSLGIFVFLKNTKSKVNFTFFLHALAVTIWLFATFMMFYYKDDLVKVIFWDRMVYAGVVFVPAFMYHFYLAYVNKKNDVLLVVAYILSFLFLIASRTDYFVKDVFTYKWGIHTKAQFFHHLFIVYFFTYVVIWFTRMYKFYSSLDSALRKKQAKYILYDFLSLFSIGSMAYLPAYGVGIYPFAYLGGLLFVFILGYAIVNTRLMDIKVVFRQSTVFLGSLLSTVVPIFGLKYFSQQFLPTSGYWSEIILLIIAAILFPIIKEKFSRFANRYLFTSLYDSKFVIRELTTALTTTLETKRIYQSVVDSLTDALHSKSISFWQYEASKKSYILDFAKGLSLKSDFKIRASQNIFNNYFIFNKAVSIEELKNSPLKSLSFIKDFSAVGIEVIVPLLIKDKLIGLICFGPKLSGDIYNNEDFDLLRVISAQVAISLENAFLYEETKQFNLKLSDEISKATKDLRAANEELKNLDRAKSEFISIASHQLRTPLTVIKGYGSMMLEGSFGQMSQPISDNVKKIYESNERLITLVEDLLNISRIESGKLQFNFETGQLEEIVGSVIEELTVPATNKGLQLIWHAPESKLPTVSIDKSKIRQVAINIIDNAIKYTPKGSVEVTIGLEGDHILFSCKDTGLGIAHNDLINLFKKFSRGEHVSLLHTEGTGLGLYVGKMMIEAHHGKIWAESLGIDKGSQFYFTLPITK